MKEKKEAISGTVTGNDQHVGFRAMIMKQAIEYNLAKPWPPTHSRDGAGIFIAIFDHAMPALGHGRWIKNALQAAGTTEELIASPSESSIWSARSSTRSSSKAGSPRDGEQ